MNRIIIKAAALFWIASVFVGNTTNAQNVKTYSGEMKVPLDLKDICSPWSFDYSSKKYWVSISTTKTKMGIEYGMGNSRWLLIVLDIETKF